MSIDILSERILTLAQAAKLIPRRRKNKPCNICTLYRWITTGIRGVRLEYTIIGGSRCTSHEALQRFYDTLTQQAEAERAPVSTSSKPLRVSRDRQQRISAAKKRLTRAGV